MISRRLNILWLLLLLVACGAPAEQNNVADQPAARATSTATTQPSATPSPAPATPTLIPATPTASPAATQTTAPATPTASPTAAPATPTAAPTAPATPTAAASGVLTGTVNYPAEAATADAQLIVRLKGVPGIGVNLLAEQTFANVPPAPVAFTLNYDAVMISPIEYPVIYVEATIERDGIVLFEHELFRVLTEGYPTTADLTLVASTRPVVSGTISYPTKDVLPADATLTVWLAIDPAALPHAQGEQIITPDASGSTPFTVQTAFRRETPGDSYQLYAALHGGGKLLYVTNQIMPVTLAEHHATVDLTLERPAQVGAVSGTISYPATSQLPADAVLTVEFRNVSVADAPAPLLGEQRITPVGPGPIPFTIEYDPKLTKSGSDYAVSAQVYVGEKLLLASTMRYEVQPGGTTPIAIEMQAFGN